MGVWMMTHDCRHCNKPHPVCLEEDPDDDGVYAYICPETSKESKFRFKDMATRRVDKCEAKSVRAYRSEA